MPLEAPRVVNAAGIAFAREAGYLRRWHGVCAAPRYPNLCPPSPSLSAWLPSRQLVVVMHVAVAPYDRSQSILFSIRRCRLSVDWTATRSYNPRRRMHAPQVTARQLPVQDSSQQFHVRVTAIALRHGYIYYVLQHLATSLDSVQTSSNRMMQYMRELLAARRKCQNAFISKTKRMLPTPPHTFSMRHHGPGKR